MTKKHKDIIIDRIKRIFKPSKKTEGPTKESGSNSYASENKKMIKDLKKA